MDDYEFDYELSAEELVDNHGYLGFWGRFGVKRALRYLPRILLEGETIFAITRGLINVRPWLLVVTSLRVIILRQGWFFGFRLLEIPLPSVKAVYHHVGLFFGEIVFALGEIQTRLGGVNKKILPTLMTHLTGALNGTDNLIDQTPKTDPLAQLERLTELKAKGTLSEAEFLAQKKKILSGR
ncbi:MAG: PH domain-containing protein [Deltaproteobacteria bacterium]|jgi:hypothetical protein|nr:PH domain-containing protein [Deltaproteobacteria bacterium]